jgi:hypothetical protein
MTNEIVCVKVIFDTRKMFSLILIVLVQLNGSVKVRLKLKRSRCYMMHAKAPVLLAGYTFLGATSETALTVSASASLLLNFSPYQKVSYISLSTTTVDRLIITLWHRDRTLYCT